MRITLQDTDKLSKVAVLGQLDQPGECEQLLGILAAYRTKFARHNTVLELDFYDAEQLPVEIIEAVSYLLAAPLPVKIVVYRDALAHTLARLGITFRKATSYPLLSPLAECKAVVMAGSAQSLDKILHIISCLPETEVVIFIAQHIREDQINLLDKLLKVVTHYRVVMPQHLMPVEVGTIYVAPPAHHLKVAHGLIYLTRDRKIQFARPSIDVLFESVAAEYGKHALAVLLCGFGQDGVKGCATLKAVGACVIIENGEECHEAAVLPNHARQAGHFDHSLSCAAIASVIAAAVSGAKAAPATRLQQLFLQAIKADYGYDLLGYHHDSLERRIKSMMISFGVSSFCDFQRLVLSDGKLFQRLISELSVSVTAFFRHPEQMKLLREEILPYLASFSLLKIWSAGCATGEEPYSLRFLLQELGLLEKSRIFATDINPYLLTLAKMRLFPLDELKTSRDNYSGSGGVLGFDRYITAYPHFFKITEQLGKPILFHRHSLTQDGVFNEFALIICRNVLIYFDAQTQQQVLRCFANSLHADGFLLLGSQDGLQNAARLAGFIPYKTGSHVYKLPAGGKDV
jgi:chemotaxis protein methyltransferase CheR